MSALRAINSEKILTGFLLFIPVIALCCPRFFAFYPVIMTVIFVPVLYFLHKKQVPASRELFLWCVAFSGLAALSSLWAMDTGLALERAGKIAAILLPGVLFISLLKHVDLGSSRLCTKIFAGLVGGLFLVLAADIIFDYPLYRFLNSLESTDPVSESRLNRSIIPVAAFLFAGYAMLVKIKKTYAAVALLFSFLPLAYLADSQSVILAVVLSGIIFFLFPYGRRWGWWAFGILLISLTFAAPFLAQFLFLHFAGDIETLPFFGGNQGYGAQRLEIWDMVGRFALQSPFYGHGIEATRAVGAFDMDHMYRESATVLHPHNFAIQIWVEFGLIGIVLVSAFFARVIQKISNMSYDCARLMLSNFVFFLTIAAFSYGLWQSWFLGLMITSFATHLLICRILKQRHDPAVQEISTSQTQ